MTLLTSIHLWEIKKILPGSDRIITELKDIDFYLDEVKFPHPNRVSITGIVVIESNFHINALWITEDKNPTDIMTIYHPLPCYVKDECWYIGNDLYQSSQFDYK